MKQYVMIAMKLQAILQKELNLELSVVNAIKKEVIRMTSVNLNDILDLNEETYKIQKKFLKKMEQIFK